MPICPSLKQDDVRDEFNRLAARLGGKAMTAEDAVNRDAYVAALTPQERAAYYEAYAHWNQHGGDAAKAHAALDDYDAAYAALAPHPAATQPREDATGRFTPITQEPTPTGISHSVIQAERKLRGAPLFGKARRAYGVDFDEGVHAVETDTMFPLTPKGRNESPPMGDVRALAADQAAATRARPLSTTEQMALLYDKMRIMNGLRDAERAFNDAKDPDAITQATARIAEGNRLLGLNEEAVFRTRSESGRSLGIGREMIDAQYNRTNVTATATKLNKGKALPAEVQGRIDAATAEITRLNEALEASEQQRQQLASKVAEKAAVDDLARQVRPKRTKEVVDAEARTLVARLAELTKSDLPPCEV